MSTPPPSSSNEDEDFSDDLDSETIGFYTSNPNHTPRVPDKIIASRHFTYNYYSVVRFCVTEINKAEVRRFRSDYWHLKTLLPDLLDHAIQRREWILVDNQHNRKLCGGIAPAFLEMWVKSMGDVKVKVDALKWELQALAGEMRARFPDERYGLLRDEVFE